MKTRGGERTLNIKARSSLEAARTLFAAKNYNGAANRAYYAVYQALVWRWEDDGFRAEDLDRSAKDKQDRGIAPSWSHSFVCNNLKSMKLSVKQEVLIRMALSLRISADYSTDEVGKGVQFVIEGIPDIFAQVRLEV